MRDFWLCDEEGRTDPSSDPLGLSSTVWRRLYPTIARDEERPLLAGLWQYHWGQEADALLSPDELTRLGREVASWREAFQDDVDPDCDGFLDELAALIDRASESGHGLRVIAD